jgi:hypothetical protein
MLFPFAVSQCPGVPHATWRYDASSTGGADPSQAGDRVVHPQAMHVQKVQVRRIHGWGQPVGIAEGIGTMPEKGDNGGTPPVRFALRLPFGQPKDGYLAFQIGLQGEGQARDSFMHTTRPIG